MSKHNISIEIKDIDIEESGVGHGYYSFKYVLKLDDRAVQQEEISDSYNGLTVGEVNDLLNGDFALGRVLVSFGEDIG